MRSSLIESTRSRPLTEMPGPKGAPLLGNMLQLNPKSIHHTLEGWSKDWGSIYKLKLGTRAVVVISDPELCTQVLRDRPEGYRRLRIIENVLEEIGVNGVFSVEGETWRKQRPIAVEALGLQHLKQFYPTLLRVTERLKKRWQKAAKTGQTVDVQKDLMRFTVDVTTSLTFGYDLNTLEGSEDVIQKHLETLFPAINRRINAPFPYWRFINLKEDRKVEKALVELQKIVSGLIEKTRVRLKINPELKEKPSNFLETLVAAQEVGELSDEDVFANAVTMLLGGEDTTANTLAWMLHYLLLYPEVQAQMREEVDKVVGETHLSQDLNRLKELHYVDAVASETMRLKPVAVTGYFETNGDSELAEWYLPKGTPVFVLTRPAMLEDKHFTDASSFNPERWLAGCPVHNKTAFYPFGMGPRHCPGRALALLEIKTVMVMLYRNFDIVRVGSANDVKEVLNFTMMPSGLGIRFVRRDP